ncbi:DNA repair protein RecN [Azospira inquinata]|uniref:DNA repair protein RecN n=1 Tax=Azospira inquinata TaxID=2785627 RepID=A0A975SLK6_9RHOO|nr:DNA repair protein RecN [Azospira inquinata]QWT46095.1 DNA repair protein RecN [Azospira inquinata]QWT48576.1 DNA repair protein RecN [Azospira inquinata]
MLRRLSIRDFVLVDRLELEFATGFGALTGETGAGKSILVDALAFVLGERADSGLLRSGAERMEVAAEFDGADGGHATDLAAWLRDNDFAPADAGEPLLLRRVLDGNGRSRAYINGSAATLQQLRQVAEWLVDIHGQHAHQSLLRHEVQRHLVDAHGGAGDLARQVASAWKSWRDAQSALEAAARGGEALRREREQLEWQVQELEALGFSPEEWSELNQEHRRLSHAASLLEGAQFSLGLLSEGEEACEARIGAVASRLEDLSEYDPALAEVLALVQSAQAELGEGVSALRRYGDRVDLDPQRLREVEGRLEGVISLARKYRVTPEGLPDLLAESQARLQALGDAANLEVLESRAQAAAAHYRELAQGLSLARQTAAQDLSAAVSASMQELALGGGRFQVALVPQEEGSASGLEQVEFRIAGLAGNEPRPLAKVASGGELSRISLAIQVVTSRQASVPTLIFDEVDVGIGGGVAEVVGRLLHRLGEERQVLCVTHLPQVAARADWQWQVAKSRSGETVTSRVSVLDKSGRVEEIARMLGGVEITATTRRHAKELLEG